MAVDSSKLLVFALGTLLFAASAGLLAQSVELEESGIEHGGIEHVPSAPPDPRSDAHPAAQADEFSALSGPYLGQQPPGDLPEAFAPGLIATADDFTGGITFSADADVLVYKLYVPGAADIEQIWFSAKAAGHWSEPARAPFDGEFDDWDFQFSRTGRRLFFTSRRPAVFDGQTSRYSHIWQVDHTSSGWTEPVLVPAPVNELNTYSGYPSATTDGTLYFHSERPDSEGKIDIYRARLVDGRYGEIEHLGGPINTSYRELDPAIAPDESALVFLSNRPGSGPHSYDLFVSYRDAEDNWSLPRGLFALVGNGSGLPGFSADGEYFFFTGVDKDGEGDGATVLAMNPYWVSTDALPATLPPAPYLGLTPPLDGAEVFAPGSITTGMRDIMSGALNGGRRLLFERIPPGYREGDPTPFYVMELVDGRWVGPLRSAFPMKEWYKNFTGPGSSQEMIIARPRPRETAEAPFLLDLWSVRQTPEGWSEPKILAINSDRFDTWASVAADGTLYFFSGRDGGFGQHDLYRSGKRDGAYLTVENLGPVINTSDSELDPLIAADESYLIFCSKARGGFGDQDLYVSFRQADGSWSEPQNMGATVNTSGEDMRPILSSDGKVLFFTSDVTGVMNIHWIDASFVQRLRPAG